MSVRQPRYKNFIYLFRIYLTLLSVAETRECRTIERIMNYELERDWKAAVMAPCEVLYLTLSGVIWGDQENPDKLYWSPATHTNLGPPKYREELPSPRTSTFRHNLRYKRKSLTLAMQMNYV